MAALIVQDDAFDSATESGELSADQLRQVVDGAQSARSVVAGAGVTGGG